MIWVHSNLHLQQCNPTSMKADYQSKEEKPLRHQTIPSCSGPKHLLSFLHASSLPISRILLPLFLLVSYHLLNWGVSCSHLLSLPSNLAHWSWTTNTEICTAPVSNGDNS